MKNFKQILCLGAILISTQMAWAEHHESSDKSAKHHGPPKEALTACEGKKSGDACSFAGHKGNIDGTCHSPDAAKPLACKPAHKK